MVNNEQFKSAAFNMVKHYLTKKGIETENLEINAIDESTIGDLKKGIFNSNKTEQYLFEVVLDLINNKASLTVLLIEDIISFDVTINEKQEEKK